MLMSEVSYRCQYDCVVPVFLQFIIICLLCCVAVACVVTGHKCTLTAVFLVRHCRKTAAPKKTIGCWQPTASRTTMMKVSVFVLQKLTFWGIWWHKGAVTSVLLLLLIITAVSGSTVSLLSWQSKARTGQD